MSIEDPTFTDLILGIALRQQPLVSLAIADPFHAFSKFASSSSSVKPACSSAKPATFEKKTASEPMKGNSHTYRCQKYGTLQANVRVKPRPS